MSDGDEKNLLTEAVKASVKGSGALANFKQISSPDPLPEQPEDSHALKEQAKDMADSMQQLLDGGTLDDTTSQKLAVALGKLRSALGKDTISRVALAAALSEATATMRGADGSGKNTTQQQVAAQLWLRVEADNKAIDDDFAQMRKAGVAFNEPLWNKHKQLMEYLKSHPHDLKTQKELDAVDDALLMQAEPQLKDCPNAKAAFDDAKTKSKDRHQVVDEALAGIKKKHADLNATADSDWDMPEKTAKSMQSASRDISINDIEPPSVGQKVRNTIKSQSV